MSEKSPSQTPLVAAYHSASVLLNATHFCVRLVDQITLPLRTCMADEVERFDQSESENVSITFMLFSVSTSLKPGLKRHAFARSFHPQSKMFTVFGVCN